MDILSTIFFVLFEIYFSIDLTDSKTRSVRRYTSLRSSRSRYSYYTYYSSSGGGGGSTIGGIISGVIFLTIFVIALLIFFVPVCKRKCTHFSFSSMLKKVNVTKTPDKNTDMSKKKKEALNLADSGDDSKMGEIFTVKGAQKTTNVNGRQKHAKITKNRRTLSAPIAEMNISANASNKMSKQKPEQLVSKVHGKARKEKKKGTNDTRNSPPPPYDELEYKPRLPPSYASSKTAFPPSAFDYGY